MLIVDYDTFVRMPAGTIFAPYEPCVFKERLEIKVEHGYEWNGKWGYCGTMSLEPDVCYCSYDAFNYGKCETNMSIYDGSSTDMTEYKMFAVLEKHEIERMINALKWAMDGCPGNLEGYKEKENESRNT